MPFEPTIEDPYDSGDDITGSHAGRSDKYVKRSPVWDDLRFPATVIDPPGLAGDPDFDYTNIGWLFDSALTETIFIIAQLPHSYFEGSDIKPHVHWEPTTTNTGTVLWRMSYRWRNNGETAGSFTDLDVQEAANGTAYKTQISSFGMISKPDALISSMLDIKFSRISGSDTYTADALFKEFDIHYQANTLGSLRVYIK